MGESCLRGDLEKGLPQHLVTPRIRVLETPQKSTSLELVKSEANHGLKETKERFVTGWYLRISLQAF